MREMKNERDEIAPGCAMSTAALYSEWDKWR